MTRIRILADDLTGALDSAAAFRGDVPVFLDAPGSAPSGAGVAVIATATRDVPPETLPRLLAPAIAWLAGAAVAFKKVDSLLRGNTFAEVAHVARAGGFKDVVFAPAFPAQGRFTFDGWHWVVPPGAPLADRRAVGAAPLADAFRGFGLAVAGAGPNGDREPVVVIPEVRGPADLDLAAARSVGTAGRTLWCGSAGLAQSLARAHGLAPAVEPASEPAVPVTGFGGPVLVISASHHPVVRRQWSVLKGAERGALMAVPRQPATLRAAFRAMGEPSDFAMFDLSPMRTLAPAEAATLLARQAGMIVDETPRPAALVVIGGDTLRALCRAAGADALVARPALRPGWGCARLVGGRWDGLRCHTRSGAFGDADDLATMVRLVTGHTEPRKETSR